MTKEKVIKSEYKQYHEELKPYINENGWLDTYAWLGGMGNTQCYHKLKELSLESMDQYHSKYCYWVRPRSLQGIDNNNGWLHSGYYDNQANNINPFVDGALWSVGSEINEISITEELQKQIDTLLKKPSTKRLINVLNGNPYVHNIK